MLIAEILLVKSPKNKIENEILIPTSTIAILGNRCEAKNIAELAIKQL
jgi:hypothetical protein